MLRPQGSSVGTKLTKQVDLTGEVIKLHFVVSVFPPPPLSLSTSKIRSLLNLNQYDLSWIHATRSLSGDGRGRGRTQEPLGTEHVDLLWL